MGWEADGLLLPDLIAVADVSAVTVRGPAYILTPVVRGVSSVSSIILVICRMRQSYSYAPCRDFPRKFESYWR